MKILAFVALVTTSALADTSQQHVHNTSAAFLRE